MGPPGHGRSADAIVATRPAGSGTGAGLVHVMMRGPNTELIVDTPTSQPVTVEIDGSAAASRSCLAAPARGFGSHGRGGTRGAARAAIVGGRAAIVGGTAWISRSGWTGTTCSCGRGRGRRGRGRAPLAGAVRGGVARPSRGIGPRTARVARARREGALPTAVAGRRSWVRPRARPRGRPGAATCPCGARRIRRQAAVGGELTPAWVSAMVASIEPVRTGEKPAREHVDATSAVSAS
jgi:hypothetical protein